MKKNITINMFGQLYAIDEDAYELLKEYLDAIRQHFRKSEGGDEIADDIEGRIGELFAELTSSGVHAITIENVEDIIKRIGKPEDIEGDETTESASSSSAEPTVEGLQSNDGNQAPGIGSPTNFNTGSPSAGTKKKYYRDEKDKIIAGVLSGASNYFGGESLWWRIGFVLFVVLWNSVSHWWIFDSINIIPIFSAPILLYILLAFLAPCAKTPEERLKMKGMDVNPQNLAAELSQEAKEREAYATLQNNGSGSRGCVGGFFSVLGVLVKIFIGLLSLFFFVMFIVVIVGMVNMIVSPESYSSHFIDPELVNIYHNHTGLFWLIAICLLLISFIPGYCAFHSLLSSMGKTSNMSMGQRWMWFVLWIGAIVVITISGIHTTKILHKYYIEEHTHDGQFYRSNADWEFFKQNNFRVIGVKEGVDEWGNYQNSTDYGNYYKSRQRYFTANDYDLLDYYQIEREDSALTPGTYRLTAVARTDDEGAFLYVIADDNKQVCAIPANGGEGGNIFEEAKQALSAHPEDSLKYKDIVVSNDSCGLGWNKVVIDNIVLKGTTMKYGVSTIPSFTGSSTNCTWVESTDFKLEKVK